MMIKRLLFALAVLYTAGTAAAAPAAKQQTLQAEYCPQPQSCSRAEIIRLLLPDAAQTRFADQILKEGIRQLSGAEKTPALTQAALLALLKETIPDGAAGYEFQARIDRVGQSPDYLQLEYSGYADTGGAHGNGTLVYYVLPRNGSRPLALADILISGKLSAFKQLQSAKWRKQLREDKDYAMNERQIREHLNMFPFAAETANWLFVPGGLAVQFQTYQIASYAMGQPQLVFSIKELEGIVKPEILQQAKAYKKQM